MGKENKEAFNCLPWAFLAFGCVGLEIVALLAEGVIYGSFSFGEWTTAAKLGHWAVTCILWGTSGYAIIRYMGKMGIDVFGKGQKLSAKNWLGVFICILLSAAFSWISWGGRFKPAVEFAGLGPLKFCFQYLYYLFESLLMILTITLAQKYFDGKLHGKFARYLPSGGIFLGLTWGLMHTFSKGSLLVGLECLITALLYGAAYLAVKKDWRYAYPVIALMFMV